MFWPKGYRHCVDVLGQAAAFTHLQGRELVPGTMQFRNAAMNHTLGALFEARTLSVVFLDGRISRVEPSIFLDYWAIHRDGDEIEPLLLYWTDQFSFDPSVAICLEAYLSHKLSDSIPRQSPKEKLKIFWRNFTTGGPLSTKADGASASISLPTRPEGLSDSVREHFELSRRNRSMGVLQGGQLVVEEADFEEITKRFDNARPPQLPAIPQIESKRRGRPAMTSKVSDILVSVFMAKIEEFRDVKQDALLKAAQDWAKKHTGHEPGRSTVQGWLTPVLEKLARK